MEKLGEGGMGVVWQARDTHLNRLVALKFLSAEKVADPERKRRFAQEAKTASALNHPNIITIHEISNLDGIDFIAMEYVRGKSLDQLISRKGLPLNQTLKYGVQIADALTKAHAAGIIHRDLKPGNIMVTEDGLVKVLDFGLAKLTDVPEGVDDAGTRTIGSHTEEGTIVGTTSYMSPEQAEGKKLDARSDIFAFGAVLYEMVTGRRAFHGDSRMSTLAAILNKEPRQVSEIIEGVPRDVEKIVNRCLRKDPARRFQHAADLKVALQELKEESDSGRLTPAIAAQKVSRSLLWPSIAALCVLIAAVVALWAVRSRRPGADTRHTELIRLSPADDHSYGQATISPDGKFVAYESDRGTNRPGLKQILLQQVGGGEPIPLTHGETDAASPEFSPDGTQILYTIKNGSTSNIEIIPTLGGQPRELFQGGFRPRFSPDGRNVAFAGSDAMRLMTVPVAGGQPRGIQAIRGVNGLLWVDDQHLLFAGALSSAPDWYIIPIDGRQPIALGPSRVLEKSGFSSFFPTARVGERLLFSAKKGDQTNVWELGLQKNPWRLTGPARQLTFGTEQERVTSVSATGIAAVNISNSSSDLYATPMNLTAGEITGPTRRLTRDARRKVIVAVTGQSSLFEFGVVVPNTYIYLLRDLDNGRETQLLARGWHQRSYAMVAATGKQALIIQEDVPSYSTSLRSLDPALATEPDHIVCRRCGLPTAFTANSQSAFYDAGALIVDDPTRTTSIHVLDLSTGKARPWLSHPKFSLSAIGAFGVQSDWVLVEAQVPGDHGKPGQSYLVPWREPGPPESEWIDVSKIGLDYRAAGGSNLFYKIQGDTLMSQRFDPRKKVLQSAPLPVKLFPGSGLRPTESEAWDIGQRGMVFIHTESRASTWLMKLPE